MIIRDLEWIDDENNKLRVNHFLKGQCHEMVVEVRAWSGSLALN
jgi:hypothetical protein